MKRSNHSRMHKTQGFQQPSILCYGLGFCFKTCFFASINLVLLMLFTNFETFFFSILILFGYNCAPAIVSANGIVAGQLLLLPVNCFCAIIVFASRRREAAASADHNGPFHDGRRSRPFLLGKDVSVWFGFKMSSKCLLNAF